MEDTGPQQVDTCHPSLRLGETATFPVVQLQRQQTEGAAPGSMPPCTRLSPRPLSVHTPYRPLTESALSRTHQLCSVGRHAHSEGTEACEHPSKRLPSEPGMPVPAMPSTSPKQHGTLQTCPWNLCTNTRIAAGGKEVMRPSFTPPEAGATD